MQNDKRSIGEKLRDIDDHARDVMHERGMGESSSRAKDTSERKPYVTDRDTGDEESPKNSTR